MKGPDLPPLMSALATADDPMDVARALAEGGVDPGLIAWRVTPSDLQAALILSPDLPLGRAMAALPACMVGLQNALGALGPSELPVHLGWDGTIWVNEGLCGRFTAAAPPGADPAQVPGWLVIGFSLVLRAAPGLEAGIEEGDRPDRTSLAAEGCDIAPMDLLGAWGRHSLFWLSGIENRAGRAALAREWQGLCRGLGQGGFSGVDEDFGRLDRAGDRVILTPLTTLLTTSPGA